MFMSLSRSVRTAIKPCKSTSPGSHAAFHRGVINPVRHPREVVDESFEYFNHTSGRWSYDEPQRLKERFLRFNVTELKKVAAAVVNKDVSSVQNFSKLAEGGFNRTFSLNIDGIHVIARLPYPSTYPKRYSVASEVATMTLVRSYGVPVPEILGYSTTEDNAVGSEYIVMEKARGKEIGDAWYELSDEERLKVVVEVARLESVLFSIPLPASGSVYFRSDLDKDVATVDIAAGGVAIGKWADEQLCIGPDVAQKWWFENRSSLNVPRGPFVAAAETFTAGAIKELKWLKEYSQPRLPHILPHRELYNYQKVSPEDHTTSVEKYLRIAPHLVPKDKDYLLCPTLKHPDLQPHNIFVAEDFTITSIIDWQHCSVLPLVLQAGVPEYFQNFQDEESLRLKKPCLPPTFDSMTETEQAQSLEQYRRRHLYYYYFVATYKFNKLHYDTLLLDSTLAKQKLQQLSSAPWEGDSISLKAELIRAVQNWPVLTAGESGEVHPCPIIFSEAEVEECLRLEAEQNHIDAQMEKIRKRIGTGSDGWTANERYTDTLEENEHVKAEALDGADDDVEKEILTNWPWDDHDEV